MKTIIGVIGPAEASETEYRTAEEVGREIAKRNGVLVCGGLGGVMEAACCGAKSEGGLTVGIVPGFSIYDANPYVDIPIVTGISHARNVIVVRSSNAIIAIGGSYGTLSEIAFALKLNIPTIGINTWEVSPDIKRVSTPKEAVDLAFSLARPRA
ncbi:MAG TPA: TIGR00725 family protein [Thermodesulfobacteriota bacterium]|nr:TIGR00725 family protein [Thermodesulfobacteriota bacterium]